MILIKGEKTNDLDRSMEIIVRMRPMRDAIVLKRSSISSRSRIIETIESLVQSRELEKANIAIQDFIDNSLNTYDTLFLCCEWYRRLGEFQKGLQLINPGRSLKRVCSTDSTEGKRHLWTARFLNLMGASNFALNILNNLTSFSTEDCLTIGNIYTTNGRPADGIHYLGQILKNDPQLSTYAHRMGAISYADCLMDLNRADEAFAVLERVESASKEPLITSICLQARGEYNARLGNFEMALKYLEQSLKRIPQSDRTVDYGFVQKWLGYTYAKLGFEKQAKHAFKEALMTLKKPHYRPIVWMEVYALMAQTDLLESNDRKLFETYPERPQGQRAFASTIILNSDAAIKIHFDHDEYEMDGNRFLGIPLEIKLLGLMRLCGSWGLSLETAKSILWPDQTYSYPQLSDRIQKLLRRIKTLYKIKITYGNFLLTLEEESLDRIQVNATLPFQSIELKPSFLERAVPFSSKDLGQYYRLGPTQRWKNLASWVDRGWISPQGRHPRISYKILKESL